MFSNVQISVGLVSSSSSFLYNLGIYSKDFILFDTSRVWVFDNIFVCNTIQIYVPCKNFHT